MSCRSQLQNLECFKPQYCKGRIPATDIVLNFKFLRTFKSQHYKGKVPVTPAVPNHKIWSTFNSHYYRVKEHFTTTKFKFQPQLQPPSSNLGALSSLTTTMVNPATFAVVNCKLGSTFKSHYCKGRV